MPPGAVANLVVGQIKLQERRHPRQREQIVAVDLGVANLDVLDSAEPANRPDIEPRPRVTLRIVDLELGKLWKIADRIPNGQLAGRRVGLPQIDLRLDDAVEEVASHHGLYPKPQ